MSLKALIVITGTVIASAVTALPVLAPGATEGSVQARPTASAVDAPLATKVDRLRVISEDCANTVWTAVCADIYGHDQPRPSHTVGRRIGQSASVLIRIPTS